MTGPAKSAIRSAAGGIGRALVLGMGGTGLSMARHLSMRRREDPSFCAGVQAADTRSEPPQGGAIRDLLGAQNCMFGEDFAKWPAERFDEFDLVCVSPGVPPGDLRGMDGCVRASVACEFALLGMSPAYASGGGRPLALLVTGTNGKSTAASLTAELCRAAGLAAEAAGNIGRPVLDAWDEWHASGKYPDAVVVEMSSFQLFHFARSAGVAGAEGFRAHAAALLNVRPDHLDYHGSFEEYRRAKESIYGLADFAAANLDDPASASSSGASFGKEGEAITYSSRLPADWEICSGFVCGHGMSFAREEFAPSLPAETAAAALALYSSLWRGENPAVAPGRLPRESFARAFQEFQGLPHRRQVVGVFDGVSYIDDSKSTNAAAACFALQALRDSSPDQGVVLIAGGDGKGQDFAPLAEAARESVKTAVLMGRDAPSLSAALEEGGVPCRPVSDMESAVAAASDAASPGDAVILSPACSSLDAYENYAARGDDFASAVRRLHANAEESAHA